jgi:myb proto-oncogene protein
MELNTMLIDEFPFLSNLLSEYNLNPEGTNDFSLEEALSSKGLFYNFHHLGYGHPTNITPPYLDLDHFTIEGSSQNPFSGISGTCIDPARLDSLASGFSSHDLNAYTPTVVPLLPAGCGDRLLHGLQRGSVRDHDYQKISGARSLNQKEMKEQRGFEEIGRTRTANNGVSTDEASCVSTEDSKHHKQVDHHRKAKKLLLEKDSKVHKKSQVIKGQWTPQEDR